MRGWLTMVAMLVWATPVQAGNDDGFFQGNEAAMQGGAVAATGTGAGQLWYNPGALAVGEGNRIELSGSLFALRFRELDPYMELAAPDGAVVAANSERSIDFLSVPSALSYTRRIGRRVRAGIGVFVQRQDSVDLNSTLEWSDDAGTELSYRRALKFNQQRLFAGPGLSVDLGKLSLGASLFFVYEQSAYEEISSLFVTAPGPTEAAATEEYRVDTRRYGLELVLGAHLKLGSHVHAGVVLRGPRFRLTDELSVGRVGTESYTSATGAQVTTADDPPFAFRSDRALAAPARLVFALGYVTGDLTLAAELDVAHPYSGFEEYLWTYNLRAGATIAITDTMKLGVGFFTDRANVASSNSAFQSFLDYYGGNLAISTATPVGVRGDEDDTPDRLVFHSTVSLRYAAGVGSGAGAIAYADQIDDDASVGVFLFGEEQRFLVHEIALYIGSGLDF
jgi:hypothetical protein